MQNVAKQTALAGNMLPNIGPSLPNSPRRRLYRKVQRCGLVRGALVGSRHATDWELNDVEAAGPTDSRPRRNIPLVNGMTDAVAPCQQSIGCRNCVARYATDLVAALFSTDWRFDTRCALNRPPWSLAFTNWRTFRTSARYESGHDRLSRTSRRSSPYLDREIIHRVVVKARSGARADPQSMKRRPAGSAYQ